MIYVIGEQRSGPVKIGLAHDPISRLRELQTASPRRLRLLLTLEGGRQNELALHRAFEARRMSGEWFDFSDVDAVAAVAGTVIELPDEPALPGPLDVERLLEDLPAVFSGADRLPTRTILDRLAALPDGPWSFTSPQDGGKRVATALRTLGVAPRIFRHEGKTHRGYAWPDLASARVHRAT